MVRLWTELRMLMERYISGMSEGIGKVLKELGVEIGTEGFNKSSLKNWSMDGIAIKICK